MDVGEFICPRCGEQIDVRDELSEMSIDVEAGAAALISGEQVRGPFDCPVCDDPLNLVIEDDGQGDIGVDVWVEDRREG